MEMSEIELEKQLLEAGNRLLSPPSLASELLESLNLVEYLLLEVEQSPSESMREALAPSTKALIAEELLRHSDTDVKVAVASCISEITRITAPDAPYTDDEMKEVFHLIVSSFEKLDDKSSRSYIKRISILETLARVRSCVVMLDLECDDLVVEMFRHFLRTIRDDHHEGVFTSMETIMTLVLEESEAISVDLLSSILNILKKEDKEVLPIARLLGEKVIVNCASKVKPYLLSAVRSSGASLDNYSKAVADICQTGGEAIEPTDDVTNKNSADENDLLNAPSEKAVEVALESMEDAPPSEEVGPSTVGSPKTVMSNGSLKQGSEDTPATNGNSMEVDNDTLDDKAEPSKTEVESVADEEISKSKPQKSNRRKGRKSNSTKSSKSFAPILSDRKSEVIDTPEHEENDAKDVDDINQEDPATDTTVAAHNEKSLEEPILSPVASDNAHVDPSLPSTTGSLADETLSDKTGLEKKKEHPILENESANDVDGKKESDTQQDSEGAAGLDSTLNKHAASDQEERVADSANDTKNEGDNINELDGNSAKEVVQEAEAGSSQRVNKKKRGQTKATPAKGHSKTPAKDDKKKTVVIPKPTPKATKDVSGMEEAAKSSSKRKRPSEEKAHQTKDYGPELVGSKVEVWWPDDSKFYKGVVKSFDAAEIKHKIFYDDGDIELLDLKNERWKFAGKNEVHASDGESPDESADETPIGKKGKTIADLGAKQGKTLSSAKMSGASSSKSKSALKSGKAKEETSKKVGKSVSKASKSGNKFSDDTSKSAKKSKDDEDSPKGIVKSKQGTSAKSKGKSPKSVGKSNSSTSKKVKVSTSSADEDTEDESPEPNKPKGKSPTTQKSQKNSNKRKR
ncbi:sister chromatid cohesion protein PDS5 homolog C-like isoform X2 [Silene latifolia]|uniref:sister chromatid cohesion protein PDS5 homolog C-like isoform X1 n=1 Tax=Silene latifolia TaxID=37657 RepID=UPI003D788CF6